jgi:hypothetical protein
MQEDQQCFAVVLSVASSPLLPDGVAAVTQSKDDNHLHDDAAGMQSKPPSSASAVSVPATASHPEAVRPASDRAGFNDATTCEATTLPGQDNYDKSVEDDDAWLLVGGGRSDPPPQGEQHQVLSVAAGKKLNSCSIYAWLFWLWLPRCTLPVTVWLRYFNWIFVAQLHLGLYIEIVTKYLVTF